MARQCSSSSNQRIQFPKRLVPLHGCRGSVGGAQRCYPIPTIFLLASSLEKMTAPTTLNPAATKNGKFHPYHSTRYPIIVVPIAPPMLPHEFITAAVDPAKSPPISSGIAHDAATVSSSAPNARQLK